MLRAIATLLLVCLVAACSSTSPTTGNSTSSPVLPTPSSTTPPTPEAPQPSQRATRGPTPEPTPASGPVRGIDVSHHQGPINWREVSRDGIDFVYLKATEGRTFTDPRFVAHSRDAGDSGLRVGAYHYFSLCSPGAEQGQHFAATVTAQTDIGVRLALPPAVDLELLGSCDNPPERSVLLEQVRDFIDVVEQATGQRVIIYSFPDFEDRYGFSADLDRRQWVRRLGDEPPARDWWLWQRSQSATVAGIDGPVDLNVLRPEA